MGLIHDIENNDYETLKAEKDAIIASLSDTPWDEVAQQYVKTLITAKHRDEKLAEQAKTLEALQKGLDAVEERAAANAKEAAEALATIKGELAECAAAKDEFQAMATTLQQNYKDASAEWADKLAATIADKDATICEQGGKIGDLALRCKRLAVQAGKCNNAISTAHKVLLDAIQARELAKADSSGAGE